MLRQVKVIEIVISVIKFLPGIIKMCLMYIFLFAELLKQTVNNSFVFLNIKSQCADLAYVKYSFEFFFIFIIEVDHFL
jgi:hypothetical protein